MIVGLGGNNGTTLTAGVIANRRHLTWDTKIGPQSANYYGSLTQCATTYLGDDASRGPVVAAFKDLLPMVDPNELVISGWDISGANMYEAAKRARVLEPGLIEQLRDELTAMTPLPSAFDPTFVAPNQEKRADNVLPGDSKDDVKNLLRGQMRAFKESNVLDQVIILWSANTERYCEVSAGVHDTPANLLQAIKDNHAEISPSTLFAVAAIEEGFPYVNGSPQNTFVPGLVQYAIDWKAIIMGDDFKTGQTKFKTVVVDFLISSELKCTAIASYNHLGNNDGLNLPYVSAYASILYISESSIQHTTLTRFDYIRSIGFEREVN
jgi:myo-inositol-1-phosphate synthase